MRFQSFDLFKHQGFLFAFEVSLCLLNLVLCMFAFFQHAKLELVDFRTFVVSIQTYTKGHTSHRFVKKST